MPRIHRRAPSRRDWNDLHRGQLRRGPIASHDRFGERMRVSCRRRPEVKDFDAPTMALAKMAWNDLADELLDGVADPSTIWAFRRFGRCHA